MPRDIDPREQHARRAAEEERRAMEEQQRIADEAKEADERNARHRRVAKQLDTATEESLLFLTKALRGGVPLDETDNRILLGAASSTVGAWSRLQATESAREQTEIVRAGIFARDLGGKQTDYLKDAPRPLLKAVGD